MNTRSIISLCREFFGLLPLQDQSSKTYPPRVVLVISLALAVMIGTLYWQTLGHEFVFDDELYVSENSVVNKGVTQDNIAWAFNLTQQNEKAYWHPITWLSHMTDVEIFGLHPAGHHLVNIIIHLANTLLILTLLFRMTDALWESVVVAALFALHPVNVETVAWVAERKNVLSTFFLLLTLHAYVSYARRPHFFPYLMALLAFGIGLMAKPMLITVPFVLLLVDYWPLARLRLSENGNIFRLVWEKFPFVLIAIGSLVISIQSLAMANNLLPTITVPWLLRIENALVSYQNYIGKLLWPTNLTVFYPFPSEIPLWKALAALGVLLWITVFVTIRAKTQPAFFVGWFWFIGTLIPVSGLIQAGLWPAMADRWAYIPFIGLFVAIVWGVAPYYKSRPQYKMVWISLLFVIIFTLAWRTWAQISFWQNPLTLFSHAIRFAGNDYVINLNYATALYNDNRTDEAIYYYRRAVTINPNGRKARQGLGVLLLQNGKIEEAIVHLQEALRLIPDKAQIVYFNLGVAFERLGQFSMARDHYEKALLLDPEYSEVYYSLGGICEKEGRFENAKKYYEQVIQHNPNFYKAYNALGVMYAQQGAFREAVGYLKEALKIKPDDNTTRLNLNRAMKIINQENPK